MSNNIKELLRGKGLLAELEDCRNEEEAIDVLKRENLWGGSVNYPELEELKESYKNGEIEVDGTLTLSQLDMVAGGAPVSAHEKAKKTLTVADVVKLLTNKRREYVPLEGRKTGFVDFDAIDENNAKLREFEEEHGFVTKEGEAPMPPELPLYAPNELTAHIANKVKSEVQGCKVKYEVEDCEDTEYSELVITDKDGLYLDEEESDGHFYTEEENYSEENELSKNTEYSELVITDEDEFYHDETESDGYFYAEGDNYNKEIEPKENCELVITDEYEFYHDKTESDRYFYTEGDNYNEENELNKNTEYSELVITDVDAESIDVNDIRELSRNGAKELVHDKSLQGWEFIYDIERKIVFGPKNMSELSYVSHSLEKINSGEFEITTNLIIIDPWLDRLDFIPQELVSVYEDKNCKTVDIFETKFTDIEANCFTFRDMMRFFYLGIQEVKLYEGLQCMKYVFDMGKGILHICENTNGISCKLYNLMEKISNGEIERQMSSIIIIINDNGECVPFSTEIVGINQNIFSAQEIIEIHNSTLKKIEGANIYFGGRVCVYDGLREILYVKKGCNKEVIKTMIHKIEEFQKSNYGSYDSFATFDYLGNMVEQFNIVKLVGDSLKGISIDNILRLSRKGVRKMETIEYLDEYGKSIFIPSTKTLYVDNYSSNLDIELIADNLPDQKAYENTFTDSNLMLFNVNDGRIETTDYKEDVANMNIENFIISALSKIIVRDEKENIYIDENGCLSNKETGELLTVSTILRSMLAVHNNLPKQLQNLFYEQLLSVKSLFFEASEEGSSTNGLYTAKEKEIKLYVIYVRTILHELGHAAHDANRPVGTFRNIGASSDLTEAATFITEKFVDTNEWTLTDAGKMFAQELRKLSNDNVLDVSRIWDSFVCLVEGITGKYITQLGWLNIHKESYCNCSEAYANLNSCILGSFDPDSAWAAQEILKLFIKYMPELIEAYVKEMLKMPYEESVETIKQCAGLEKSQANNLTDLSKELLWGKRCKSKVC